MKNQIPFQYLKQEVMETYRTALKMNSDIYRLSEVVYKKDINTWKQIEKKGKIPLNKHSITVKVDVKVIHGNKQRLKPTWIKI
ncbi:Ger(x)C family spore germination C-terminal domain-containing protein [Fictibacillus sp. B-59209]|uniref:Ger(x)C family spore germination C-terminal domain-containing protein n=1 Tax=Fictibacillus sp. B-59209 TaxID=3024873 RepID=UPI003CD0CAD4